MRHQKDFEVNRITMAPVCMCAQVWVSLSVGRETYMYVILRISKPGRRKGQDEPEQQVPAAENST